MFYIIEFINRLKFTCFSYCFLFVICYIYYSTFFSFFDFLFKVFLNDTKFSILNYYIYTHPLELYYSKFYVCFILSLHIILFYLIWQFFDFYLSGIYKADYLNIFSFAVKSILKVIIGFLVFYGFIVPIFFQFLKNAAVDSSFYIIFFELKVQDFIEFILYLNFLFTVLILFLIVFSFLVFMVSLLNILKYKKFICLFIIIFSTLFSPPDLFSQIFLFLFLLVNIEIIIFLRLFTV